MPVGSTLQRKRQNGPPAGGPSASPPPTVVFATTMLPGLRLTGSEVVSQTFVDAMRSAGNRVVVLGYVRAGSAPELGADEVGAGSRHIETRDAGARVALWLARAFAGREPYSVAKYRSRRYVAELKAIIERLDPSVIVLDHAQMAWALPSREPRIPTVLLAHNVEHEMYERAARERTGPLAWINRREAKRMLAFEREAVARADEAWALSPSDAAGLAGLGALAPVAFEFAALSDVPPSGAEKRYDVGMLGSWTWAANARGLDWFFQEVYPLLGAEVSIAVGGAGGDRVVAPRQNVERLGRVPDAFRFLSSCRVIVAPSVSGAGIQIKTLDAIATGSPVVATSFAMREIDDPPATVTSVDDPAAVAQAIGTLLGEAPDEAAARQAREWSLARGKRFGEAVAERVGSLLGADAAP